MPLQLCERWKLCESAKYNNVCFYKTKATKFRSAEDDNIICQIWINLPNFLEIRSLKLLYLQQSESSITAKESSGNYLKLQSHLEIHNPRSTMPKI